MRKLLLFCVVVAASGCFKRVPQSIIDKLPYESRIDLLEAENDLAIAVDRLDEERNEVNRARDQIRRAKDRLKSANGEVGEAKDRQSRDVAELAVTEADARIEMLKAKQRLNVVEEDVAEVGVTCAIARYEQSKLETARKKKIEGSEALDPKAFEAQVKECETRFEAARGEAKKVSAEAEDIKNKWEATRTSLAKKTFDARASPYVE
jgi:hypothetical protein